MLMGILRHNPFWHAGEAAEQFGVVRSILRRVMGGHTPVTPRMALARVIHECA